MSTKPIQDRIYRSRLTITYRTNIDGQLVPKKLPFRLLVLGNFTGSKLEDEATGVTLPAFEQRPVVTIRRGTKIKDIMREMGVTLPVPAERAPSPRGALGKGTELKCEVTDGDNVLVGDMAAVDDQGRLAVSGDVEVVASVSDGKERRLGGRVKADGTATLVASLADPRQTLELGGNLPSHISGKGDVQSPAVSESTADSIKITVAGDMPVDNSLSSTKPWKTFSFTGELAGKVVADGTSGVAKVSGRLTLEDKASGNLQIPKADLPHFVGTADVQLEKGADGKWAIKSGSAVSVAIDEDMDVEVSLTASAGDLLNAPAVTKRGALRFDIKDASLLPKAADNMEITLAGALEAEPAKLGESVALGFVFTPTGGKPEDSGKLVADGLRLQFVAKPVEVTVMGKLSQLASDGVKPEDPIMGDVIGPQTLAECAVALTDDGNVALSFGKATLKGRRLISFTSLESFHPDELAASIPEVRRLGIIRDLLGELKGDLNLSAKARNYLAAQLRKLCSPEYQKEGRLPVLLDRMRKAYPTLLVDPATDPRERVTPPVQPMEELSDNVFGRQDTWYKLESKGVSEGLFAALEMGPPSSDTWATNQLVRKASDLDAYEFYERDRIVADDASRLQNALVALILNAEGVKGRDGQPIDLAMIESNSIADAIDAIVQAIDDTVQGHLRYVLHDEAFRELERNWTSVDQLVSEVETDEVLVDLLDVSKEELGVDLKDHKSDIFTSALFKKVYVDEYDRFGGQPFGAMIGLYWFGDPGALDDEIENWLTPMSQIANAAHCPFIASVRSEFFGSDFVNWEDLDTIGDIEAHLNLPQFGKWNALRESLEAPYLGLTLPGYLLRKPWRAPESNDAGVLGNRRVKLEEIPEKDQDKNEPYLWGSAAVLVGRNMIRSFEGSGWCQYIRGVKGGGLIRGMTVNVIKRHGQEEVQSPVWYEIPDYRELQFAKSGLIPLVHNKGTADAAFFSTQSLKMPHDFMNEIDTQNSYLVTNLAYTLSITRIAHYVKAMMRDYIGSSLDAAYIQNTLQLWLDDYVTTTVNPDDLTLRYYPFKAVKVEVQPKPGPLGWFKSTISILPHIQFEGMDVELRLEAALGGGK